MVTVPCLPLCIPAKFVTSIGMPVQSRRRNAFTLLELMFAIVLLLMIVAIGIPSLRGFGKEDEMRRQFERIAKEIEDALAATRDEHTDYWIHLNEGNMLVSSAPAVDWDFLEQPTVGEGALRLLNREQDAPAVRLWRSGHAEPFELRWDGNGCHWVAAMGPLDRRVQIVEWQIE